MENLPEAGGVAVALGGTVISALTGSMTGGLLVLVFLVMLGGYFIITKHILPAHDKQLSVLMDAAKQDRKEAAADRRAFIQSLDKITAEVTALAHQIEKHGDVIKDVSIFLEQERQSDKSRAGQNRRPAPLLP